MKRAVWLVLAAGVVMLTHEHLNFAARQACWHGRRQWARVNGQMVDVGGYRLYISCSGTGSPVVVMEAGFELGGKTWRDVVSGIAGFTRVCIYDRRGLGLSDKFPQSIPTRTSTDIITDLRALLAGYGVAPPYVLVGHSQGGLHVRLFAARYPREIAGLVLVDSTHEDKPESVLNTMPIEERDAFQATLTGRNNERLDVTRSIREVRQAGSLPPVPLLVLSPNRDDFQIALARLTPSARLVTVPGSGHFIQNDAPAFLVASIRELLPWTTSDSRSR